MKLIAFCGLKGSGKSTAASFLEEEHEFQRLSFATPVKEMAMAMGLTRDQLYDPILKESLISEFGMTPREILQKLGTEVGRNFHKNIWIDILFFKIDKQYRSKDITVDDCRFLNEAEAIRKRGGHIIGIQRPGLVADDHPSEREMVDQWGNMVDTVITNDGSVDNLKYQVLECIKAIS